MISPRAISLGVFIGRFQPFHLGHQFVIGKALERVDFLLIIVGSAQVKERDIKNPFSFEERESLIRDNLKFFLSDKDFARVGIMGLPDCPGDNEAWMLSLDKSVGCFLASLENNKCLEAHQKFPRAQVFLIGHDKDESTYYLELLKNTKNWDSHLFDNYKRIDGTQIRKAYFSGSLWSDPPLLNQISTVTQNFLHNFETTPEWRGIKKSF